MKTWSAVMVAALTVAALPGLVAPAAEAVRCRGGWRGAVPVFAPASRAR